MTIIRPIILYGSERWALRKTQEVRLDTFERKASKHASKTMYIKGSHKKKVNMSCTHLEKK